MGDAGESGKLWNLREMERGFTRRRRGRGDNISRQGAELAKNVYPFSWKADASAEKWGLGGIGERWKEEESRLKGRLPP